MDIHLKHKNYEKIILIKRLKLVHQQSFTDIIFSNNFNKKNWTDGRDGEENGVDSCQNGNSSIVIRRLEAFNPFLKIFFLRIVKHAQS